MSNDLYPAGDYPVTINLGLALYGMDETLAENMILVDAAVGHGGSGAWASLTGDMTETQVAPWDGPTVGVADTGISRDGVASLAIGNGTPGNAGGNLDLAALNTNGQGVTLGGVLTGDVSYTSVLGPVTGGLDFTDTYGNIFQSGTTLEGDFFVVSTGDTLAALEASSINGGQFVLYGGNLVLLQAPTIRAVGNLYLTAGLLDINISPGLPGSFLTSTGTGVTWTPINSFDASTQSAPIASTPILPVSSTGSASLFQIGAHVRVTQAADVSSILGPITLYWVDAQGGNQTTVMGCFSSVDGSVISGGALTGNTTNDKISSIVIIDPAAGSTVYFTVGYASSGATPMQYSAHLRAINIGIIN